MLPLLSATISAMHTDFYRIERLPPYVFAEVNGMRAAMRAEGEDVIDLGMGNPDTPPPAHVVAKLAEVAAKPDAHGYSASKGIPGLRKAQGAYYQRRFGVEVDPDTEVIVTLGSKEGLANLAQAITAPGDVILAPNPSYPIHSFGFIIAGAAIRSIRAATQGAGDRLSVQPDRLCRRRSLLRKAGGVRARARDLDHLGPRLCRDLLR
jgi:alanine-synthesizing transaminase